MKIRTPSTVPPTIHFLYCLSIFLKSVLTRRFVEVKYHDISPQHTPSRMKSGICQSSNASAGASVTARIGSKPRSMKAIVVAVIEAMSSGMTDPAVMSSIRISSTNTTPVIGALKMAANAAPAPQQSSSVVCL